MDSSDSAPFSRKREGFCTECISPKRPKSASPEADGLQYYGKFFILGYNGFIPPRNYGRIRSNCRFLKRTSSNGAKVSRIKRRINQTSDDSSSTCRTIEYQFTNSDTVVVECERDLETDMLQIGRSNEFPIDFVVFNKNKNNKSTVSRFACRVIGNRNDTAETRVYAGAFDSHSKIVLGAVVILIDDNPSLHQTLCHHFLEELDLQKKRRLEQKNQRTTSISSAFISSR